MRWPLAILLLVATTPAAQPLPPSLPCALFPPDNVWNADVSVLPVHPLSDAYIGSIGATTAVHPDFGTRYHGKPNGIPYTVVPPTQRRVRTIFRYADESDPGPYPIPRNAPIEGGTRAHGDRHVLVVEAGTRSSASPRRTS